MLLKNHLKEDYFSGLRNFFDSSRVCSIIFVVASSRKTNSVSEYEERRLCILSRRGTKSTSIFFSSFLFLIGSTIVRRLSFGSFVLLTYPAPSNRSIIPVTAPVV